MIKTNPIPACNNHYISDTDYIIYIHASGAYFAKKTKDISLDNYKKYFFRQCKKGLHPAQKPVELVKRFVTVSSKEGDAVLDCFLGSGTTGVACKELNRNFIGIEQDKKYFELAKKRIEEAV